MIRTLIPTLAALTLAAADGPAVVWMGYERLVDGRPEGVRVAVTAEELVALRRAAGLDPAAPVDRSPAASLPVTEVRADPGAGRATVRWTRSVLGGSAWSGVPLPGIAPWSGPGLIPSATPGWLAVPPDHRGDLVAGGDRPLESVGETRVLRLETIGLITLAPSPGWDVLVQEGDATIPVLDGRAIAPGGPVTITWSRPVEPGRIGTQVLEGRITLAPGVDGDGVTLSMGASVRGQGGGVGPVHFRLPASVAVAAITGVGIAAWRRDGEEVVITPQDGQDSIQIMMEAHARGPGALLPRFSGTARVRVGAAPWPGRIPVLSGGDRAPATGDEVAAIETRDPGGVRLDWGAAAAPARPGELVAVIDGPDRLQVALALPGLDPRDAVAVAVPSGWTLVDGALDDEGDGRWLRGGRWLRFDVPAGTTTLPVLVPEARGPRRVLLVGAGDRDPQTAPGWLGEDAAALRGRLVGAGVVLPAGRDRAVRGEGALPVLLTPRDGESTVADSHFALVESDTVRWSTHLACDPGPGGVETLTIEVPAGMTIVRLGLPPGARSATAADGGLSIALPGRVRTPFAIDLDADIALAGGAATIRPPRLRGVRWTAGTVALAEAETGTSLLHRGGSGLVDGEPRLPDGVDIRAVQHRLAAQRPDWSLDLRRESLDLGGGPDGVATQVDVVSWWLPDGELRTRARWQVLNRSRSLLPLRLPTGVHLWEVRVAGQPVTPRQDGDRLWIPVPRQRAGEAAVRIEIDSLGRAPGPELAVPVIEGLRIMQVLWRIAGREGVDLRDGPFSVIDQIQAEADRAERASADLERLRAQPVLGTVARSRLDRELARLDLELADAQASLGRRPAAGGDWSGLISGKRASLRKLKDQNDLDQVRGFRQDLTLNIAQNGNRSWGNALVPVALPAMPAATPGLGDGEPIQAGRRAADGGPVGIDLLAGAPADGLVLRGTGGGLAVTVATAATGVRWWPWAAIAAAVALVVAAWRWRRA